MCDEKRYKPTKYNEEIQTNKIDSSVLRTLIFFVTRHIRSEAEMCRDMYALVYMVSGRTPIYQFKAHYSSII